MINYICGYCKFNFVSKFAKKKIFTYEVVERTRDFFGRISVSELKHFYQNYDEKSSPQKIKNIYSLHKKIV
jgi:hypothetical protein